MAKQTQRYQQQESLSTWQRFKRWASRSFGCASSQNIEHSVKEKQRSIKSRSKSKAEQSNEDSQKPKVKRTQSFSKDADKMQYIDESTIDIPEAVKGESTKMNPL